MAVTEGSTIRVKLNENSYTADLGGGVLWEETGLNSNTILQSFAVDYKNGNDIYIAQCRSGGTNPDKGATQGEVEINRVSKGGTKQSVIQFTHQSGWNGRSGLKHNSEFNEFDYTKENVRGWGHGTQVALEYAPDGKYLWLDYDSPCVDRVKNGSEGLGGGHYVVGKRLARVPATNGAVFNYTDSRVRTFTLNARIANLLDSDFATVSIDNVNGYLAVKYTDKGDNRMKVTVFRMKYNADYPTTKYMSDIVFTELATFIAPTVRWPRAGSNGWGKPVYGHLVPNGWTIFGDYIYFFAGTAYWSKSTSDGQKDWYSPTPDMVTKGCYKHDSNGNLVKETSSGNSHIICYNWKTNKEVERIHTEIGKSLVFRETEGMHIIPTLDSGGNVTKLRLLLGFAGGVSGARHWSILEKNGTF